MWPLKAHAPESELAAGVLAILPDGCDAGPLVDLAAKQHWKLTVVHAFDQALWQVAHHAFPLILLDRDVGSGDWRACVQSFARLRPIPSVILISSVGDHYLFDEVVKQGGFDVIRKPLEADELQRISRLAFTFWKSRSGQRSSE